MVRVPNDAKLSHIGHPISHPITRSIEPAVNGSSSDNWQLCMTNRSPAGHRQPRNRLIRFRFCRGRDVSTFETSTRIWFFSDSDLYLFRLLSTGALPPRFLPHATLWQTIPERPSIPSTEETDRSVAPLIDEGAISRCFGACALKHFLAARRDAARRSLIYSRIYAHSPLRNVSVFFLASLKCSHLAGSDRVITVQLTGAT